MIISEKSYFRNIPTNIDPTQVVIFDTIRYSIDISDISYERLIENLFEISFSQKKEKPSFPLIFLDIWSIINNITIFYNILTKHFLISESDPLFDKIRILKFLRHSNQHIEDRIDELINPEHFPVYGKLSWYAQESIDSVEGVVITLYSGAITNNPNIKAKVSNPAGKFNDRLINGIEFTGIVRDNNQLIETTVNINDIINNISEIINFLEKQISEQSQYLVKEKHVSDIIFIFKLLKQ